MTLVKKVELNLEFSSVGSSLSAKILQALRQQIHEGVLQPGDVLPSSRQLAAELKVARGTVVMAYEQLLAEGYLDAKQGSGTIVHPQLALFHSQNLRGSKVSAAAERAGAERAGVKRTDLEQASNNINKNSLVHDTRAPEQTIGDLTKKAAWRQAWRLAAQSPALEYELPVTGAPELLYEIAEHLRTMRATVREPSELLITGGAREGLGLILTALGTTRGQKLLIGVEDGVPPTLSNVAKQHGAEIVALPVDEEGLLVEALPHALLDAVIVTPSYQQPKSQQPRGLALPLNRRRELIKWAQKNGVLVIEDDFNSELRFLRSPLPTLAALDNPTNGVVATLGSFSATLSISLAAGFLVIPGVMRPHLLNVRKNLGCPVAPILQIALAELLASGELRRHVARLRRRKI